MFTDEPLHKLRYEIALIHHLAINQISTIRAQRLSLIEAVSSSF